MNDSINGASQARLVLISKSFNPLHNESCFVPISSCSEGMIRCALPRNTCRCDSHPCRVSIDTQALAAYVEKRPPRPYATLGEPLLPGQKSYFSVASGRIIVMIPPKVRCEHSHLVHAKPLNPGTCSGMKPGEVTGRRVRIYERPCQQCDGNHKIDLVVPGMQMNASCCVMMVAKFRSKHFMIHLKHFFLSRYVKLSEPLRNSEIRLPST